MKAALNHAFSDDANRIPTDKAWRTVEPFKKVGKARADHFTEAQVRQLVASAKRQDPAFADFLEGHFHAGARPHELSSAEVRHFLTADAQVIVPKGKTGARVVTLTPEGVAFFRRMAKGKQPTDLLLPRADGQPWGKSHQHRPIKIALKAAGLPVSATMYTLRHTYISRSIERGTPLTLIAENCGTSVRMIEDTYAKTIAKVRRDLIGRTAPTLRPPAPICSFGREHRVRPDTAAPQTDSPSGRRT